MPFELLPSHGDDDWADESSLKPVALDAYVARLPPPWPDHGLGQQTRRRVLETGRKVVAIDDDPTGCQTVHDVPLLLEWSAESLADGLRDPAPALFVLSNTRAMDGDRASDVNHEIARHLCQASQEVNQPFVVISRSDSTLRGHYLAETLALDDVLGPYDGVVIAPCFFEAGRYTVDGIHWVKMGDQLVPAAQTESAQDAAFGFSHSYLPAWVEEKTGGAFKVEDALLIRLDDLRRGGPRRVASLLTGVTGGRPIVLDAMSYEDLEVFVAGLLEVEAAGKRFLYRTAASFVRVRAGIAPRPLLVAGELVSDGTPGLVAVGSYVPRSTAQLEELLAWDPGAGVELDVGRLLKAADPQALVREAAEQACRVYDGGRVPVLYTSRTIVVGDGPAESLRITNMVSDALVGAVREIVSRRQFGYVVAKGGITSHELAMKALGARRTRVLGQIEPGVPVWRLGPESRMPGMPYVVFPGNVGEAGTLRQVVQTLAGSSAVGH